MTKKIVNYIIHPKYFLLWLDKKRIITLSDQMYLKIMYKKQMKEKLDLNNPKEFNQKLQWLKLNDRKDIYTTMVDKYEVKKYVSDIIGQEYIIPTLGIYDKFEDINFEELPEQFIIKCTHDSGSTIICKNKKEFNIKDAKKKINKALKREFYYAGREWPYKNVKPRILIEKYMENGNGTPINDYKFYCFDGKAQYVMVCTERNTGIPKFYYFDKNWNLQRNMSYDGLKINENDENRIIKPKNLEEMFNIVEKLSKNIKFVRTDLYNIDGDIFFGELTFYPSSGWDNTRTDECNNILNSCLKI